ncbi:TIGR00366 family protein [Salinisphaera sp. T31B1]|uniref:TIGR00366 family protein n=1 Tax=Salinisphaera sp. T31B1 TaxID=727963 RepID=UPI00333FB8BB
MAIDERELGRTRGYDSSDDAPPGSRLERIALAVTTWTERWFPDAYVIALLALVIVSGAALLIGARPTDIVSAVGDNYWNLTRFTYQMAMVILTGFALAAAPPIRRMIEALAAVPRSGPGAIAFIALMSMIAGLLNWGFGMMFSAFLVMALAARPSLNMDLRAAAAAGLLGTGSTNMVGLSSTAALLHATPASVPPELLAISGYIPLTETVFLWQNAVLIAAMATVGLFVAYCTAPRGAAVHTAESMGINAAALFADSDADDQASAERRPGDFLSDHPALALITGAVMACWISMQIWDNGFAATISNLNNYIFITLTLAILLNFRIRRFLKAVAEAVPSIGAVLIQFPIYAAVAAVLMTAENPAGQTVADYLGDMFASLASPQLLPPVVAIYSYVVGVFIPSAGAKWVLEAPYILQAGNELHSHLGWLINIYGAAESVANLLNPFWMLPILGLLSLQARSVVGFTFIYFVFLAPTVLIVGWLLGYTLPYHPPVMP